MSLITQKSDFFAGIDVGQVNDHTAMAIIERIRVVPRPDLHHALVAQAREEATATPLRLDLVHLQRIPLGTLYPKQVDIIANLLRQPVLDGVTSFIPDPHPSPLARRVAAVKTRGLRAVGRGRGPLLNCH